MMTTVTRSMADDPKIDLVNKPLQEIPEIRDQDLLLALASLARAAISYRTTLLKVLLDHRPSLHKLADQLEQADNFEHFERCAATVDKWIDHLNAVMPAWRDDTPAPPARAAPRIPRIIRDLPYSFELDRSARKEAFLATLLHQLHGVFRKSEDQIRSQANVAALRDQLRRGRLPAGPRSSRKRSRNPKEVSAIR
jgi:hypothetical protein